jgi:hypothetical protein
MEKNKNRRIPFYLVEKSVKKKIRRIPFYLMENP